MCEGNNSPGTGDQESLAGPPTDRMGDALVNGSFAHTFTGSKPPPYYDANERWAWDLGWRLQQHLQEEAGKCES